MAAATITAAGIGLASCHACGLVSRLAVETAAADVGSGWQGGFFCPCHGSKFDLAGRVFKGVPAPINLPVPPHRYADDRTLVIGEDQTGGA